MANQEKGEVGVVVGGKQYTLRPTFDALCNLEDVAGKPMHQIQEEIGQGRLSGLRSVVFSLLQDQHGQEIRTLRDASLWIERAGGPDAAMDLVNRVLGINQEEAATRPPDAQVDEKRSDGTGESSTSAPAASA